MNEALSGEVSQIIADEPSSTSSSEMSSVLEHPQGNSTRTTSDFAEVFVPYLLVHSIVSTNSGTNKTKSEWKRDKIGSGSPKNVNLVSTVQDLMMPQIMEVDEEPDVQIIGYSPPAAINNNTAPPTLLKQLLGDDVATANDVMKLEDVNMEDGDISSVAPEMYGLPDLMESKSGQVTVDVDKPGEVVVLQSDKPSNGKDKSNGSGGGSGNAQEHPPVVEKEGHAAQCIALPAEVTPDQYVVSITPNHQSSHVIVVTAPKTLHRRISALCGITPYCHSSDNASSSAATSNHITSNHNDAACNKSNEQNNTTVTTTVQRNEKRTSTGGCILIYKADVEKGRMVLLHEKPVVTRVLDSINDGIMSLLLLPRDIAQGQGEEADMQRSDFLASLQQQPSAAAAGAAVVDITSAAASDSCNNSGNDLLDGYIAVTTYSGSVNVIRISDCKVLLTIPPPDGDKFVSLTYCTGNIPSLIGTVKPALK